MGSLGLMNRVQEEEYSTVARQATHQTRFGSVISEDAFYLRCLSKSSSRHRTATPCPFPSPLSSSTDVQTSVHLGAMASTADDIVDNKTFTEGDFTIISADNVRFRIQSYLILSARCVCPKPTAHLLTSPAMYSLMRALCRSPTTTNSYT